MPTRQNRQNRKNCKSHNNQNNIDLNTSRILNDTMNNANTVISTDVDNEQTDIIDTIVSINNINTVSSDGVSNESRTATDKSAIMINTLHTADITVETLQQTDTKVQMSEYGYPMLTYTSGLKNHIITVELDVGRKQALINNMDIGECAPVELTLLLKKVENELKKLGVTTIVQQVTPSDWKNILEPLRIFQSVHYNKEHNFMTIICPIGKFPEATMKSLGFNSPINENN